MNLKDDIFKTLIRKSYSKCAEGRRVWNIANRSFLYYTPELAKSFLKLRQHPRYKKTIIDIETELIKNNSEKILKEVGEEKFNLINMGCGDGSKAKAFLETMKAKNKLRFCPVNASEILVNLAMKNIKDANFENISEYKPHIACLESLDEVASTMKNGEYQKNIILLLGSILASFEIHEYLFNLTQSMLPGDKLIIGNGIRTGERFVNLDSYKHPLFQEWLTHIIKELGFNEDEAEYGARFENGRVEGFFRLKVDKKLSHKDAEIEFKTGDEIIVAVLYKYYESELEKFCKMYFRDVELLKDPSDEYVLAICTK